MLVIEKGINDMYALSLPLKYFLPLHRLKLRIELEMRSL